MTSVAPLPRPVRVIRADSLQRVLLLPQAVHTLVPDGGERALHQLSVRRYPWLRTYPKSRSLRCAAQNKSKKSYDQLKVSFSSLIF